MCVMCLHANFLQNEPIIILLTLDMIFLLILVKVMVLVIGWNFYGSTNLY